MSVLLFPWLLVIATGPAVTVNGDATCPTAEQVSTQVAQLVPAVDTATPRDLARVEDADGALRVSLWRPDGELLGTRDLSRTSSCADLAAAAAVVVAAWESDVHPEFRPALVPAASGPPAVVRALPQPTPTRLVFEVGAALSGSIAPGAGGAGTAAGGLIVASLMPSRRAVGFRLMLAGATERDVPLGTRRVFWRRLAAGLGPDVRLAPGSAPIAVDLHAEVLVGSLSARGEGFTFNLNDTSVDPGVGAGARIAFGSRAVAPWLDLSLGGWLREQRAVSTPDQASVSLPRFEAAVAVGLSVFMGR
ncbi:MAG TPA: hypothetical protein VIQ54_08185 [Polyangia bacterium]